jgi:hypothetical protein
VGLDGWLSTLLGPEGSAAQLSPVGGGGCFFCAARLVCPGGCGWSWFRPCVENFTVDASIFVVQQATKGNRWMPRHQEPMKDVVTCDKPRGAGKRASIRGSPNRETSKETGVMSGDLCLNT